MRFKELYNLIKETYDDFENVDFDFYTDAIDRASQYVFAMLWADWIESLPRNSKNRVNLSGNEITEIAPNYKSFLTKKDSERLENKMYSIVSNFEENNGKDLKDLYIYALIKDDQDPNNPDSRSNPEDFTWLIIMKTLGHGISWNDDHSNPGFKYSYNELSYLEFPDSFPEEEEIEEEEESEIQDWEREGEEWKDGDYDRNFDNWWKDEE